LPQRKIFVVEIIYFESNEWLLIWQQNGKAEKVVAPPHYSPDKKWLASVYATEGPDDGNNGIDIVPSGFGSAKPSFHYRPREYEMWSLLGWDGNERLAVTVELYVNNNPKSVTWPAEVIRAKGAWQLNTWAPNVPQPSDSK
jgi:hypothetical protein